MNRLSVSLVSLSLALVAPAAQAASKSERLLSPELPGFVVGHSAANRTRSMLEEIPATETMANWTRMVTTQTFRGLARRLSPSEYAGKILEGLPQACPGATASSVESITVAGQRAARFRVNCPSGTGGRPETFILLAIAGQTDMYVKQVAFRGESTAEDSLWARRFLNGVVLCTKDSKVAVCR